MSFGSKVERIQYGDPVKAAKSAVSQTNLEMGVRTASQAKLLAPVRYGQLRNSLSATSIRGEHKLLNNQAGEPAPQLNTAGLQGDEVYVGSNSDHAVFMEHGTRFIAAQPFLRPAADLEITGDKLADVMGRYSRAEMEKELQERKRSVV